MGNLGCLTWVRHSSHKSSSYSIPMTSSFHAVFSCVQTKVWLPVFVIFIVDTGVNAQGCTQGCINTTRVKSLHWKLTVKRVCIEKSPVAPTSLLCLTFQSHTLSAELSLPHWSMLSENMSAFTSVQLHSSVKNMIFHVKQ